MQGTVPASVFEGYAFKTYIVGAVDDDQLLNAVALLRRAQQERAVALLTSDDGLWPGVLKLQTAFGLQERYHCLVALYFHILYTQNSDGPSLVNHHFEWGLLRDKISKHSGGWSRNGDGPVGGIEVYHALHAFHWKTVIVFFYRKAVTLLFYRPHLGVTLSGIATDDALVVFAKASDDEW